jgi:hypothetical protein
LGNVETGGTKIREFAAVTVFATDAVKMLTANLDKLINSILGNSVVTEARNTLRGEQFQLQNLQNSREQLLRNMPQFSSGTELPAVGTVPTNITREMQERLRDADRRIREQEDAIKKAEERLREEQNKIEGNTSSTTGTTGTSISSTEEVSVKTAGATKLQIDPESIAAALKPMIDHQNILINDLKIALAYQGDGINRAVNRMA